MTPSDTVLLRGLLPVDVAREVAAALEDAPFTDGRATALGSARTVKRNLQLEPAHPLAAKLGARLVEALGRSEPFKAIALPHTVLPFLFSRYDVDMGYGEHLDLPVVATASGPLRTDLSLTVFLAPAASYDGGELVVPGPGGERRIKGDLGDAVLYSSSTLHRVEPVTRGRRVVGVTWIQSLVRDPEERAILATLAETIGTLKAGGLSDADLRRLHMVQHRLLRRWVVC